MKKLILYTGLLLCSCISAEQDNPLIIDRGSCADQIQNQNEEGIDCGGVCTACEVIIPVTVPCKELLTDNVMTVDGSDRVLTSDDYGCYEESDYFEIFILKNWTETSIEIYETILPKITTQYQLTPYWDPTPGMASISYHDGWDRYYASSGELYLSYEDGHWVAELCSSTFPTGFHTYEISGRIICDW